MTNIVKSNPTRKIVRSAKTTKVNNSKIVNNIVKSNTTRKIVRSTKTAKVSNTKLRIFMDTSRFGWHKTPTPATNGTQKVFTLPDSETYVSGLLEVFIDGLIQTKDVDYTETTSSTFTMTNAPDADETLRINYIKQ